MKKFFEKHKNSNKLLILCVIISLFIVTTTFAMPKIKEKVNENKSSNINVELVDIPKNVKLVKDGDVNVGGGGSNGGYEDGNGKPDTILGNVQDEGVRVTLVESETNTPVTSSIDFANNPRRPIQAHFGKGNKLYYINNQKVTPRNDEYTWETPKSPLPRIIEGAGGGNNIEGIKKYFGDSNFVKYFSELTGFNYEEMISGKYKLMLEPVGYPKIKGKVIACTATELALYDKQLNGYIRKSAIQVFSHLNLPMCMYLEEDEFGIKAYKGSNVSKQSNDTIIAQLGVGAVTFNEEEEEPPEISYTYRTDTEVITPLKVSGIECVLKLSEEERPNIYPVRVDFEILGKHLVATNGAMVFPSGATALAYIKWRTPKEPQEFIITATINYKVIGQRIISNGESVEYIKSEQEKVKIAVKIEDLKEKVPPNPDADDQNYYFINNYKENDIKKYPEILEHQWESYEAYWHSVWVETKDGMVDRGEYKFNTIYYPAKLNAEMDLHPASTVKTAKGKTMKSGYGVDQKINAEIEVTAEIEREVEVPKVDENGNVLTDADGNVIMVWEKIREPYYPDESKLVTKVQNGASYFSDFYFKDYWRLLEETNENSLTKAIIQFKPNNYSTYKNRTHFTPIWYPDNLDYKVASYIFDGWTPKGMMSINLEDSVYIKGSLWDDWYVQPLPVYGTDPRELTYNIPQEN